MATNKFNDITNGEYTEVNNNFRHFINLEKEYLQIFVNSTTLIIAAYWFVCSVPLLRYLLCITGLFLSAGLLITELRYASYFRHFFAAAIRIEKNIFASQFTDISKYFSRPFLGIRSTNVIIAFYSFFSIFWAGVLFSDLFSFSWFQIFVKDVAAAKNLMK